jgi:hypothetical protein
VGEETAKRGDEWWGGGGEYEGVNVGEMVGLRLIQFWLQYMLRLIWRRNYTVPV